MPFVETDCWQVELPQEWYAEQEGDLIVILDVDEVSTIEITTLQAEEKQPPENNGVLGDIADEFKRQGLQEQQCTLGDFVGLRYDYVDEEGAWRDWYVFSGPVLLHISHGCERQNRGMDDAAVDEILATLRRISRTVPS